MKKLIVTNTRCATVSLNGHSNQDDEHNCSSSFNGSLPPTSESKLVNSTSTTVVPYTRTDNASTMGIPEYDTTYIFFASAVVGMVSGFTISIFKLSIESLRELMYGSTFGEHFPVALIPALGGIGVSFLSYFGEFAPGLKGIAEEVDAISINTQTDDRFQKASRFIRKPLAAIVTLGTGNSLGPEGPSVEVGMTVSRLCIPSSVVRSETTDMETIARIQRNRLLLSAGAAAGVSAGFNAPLAGVFFSLEILQQSLPPLQPLSFPTTPATTETRNDDDDDDERIDKDRWFQQTNPEAGFLSTGTGPITATLLASVLSALVSRVYLGESLALSVPSYQLNTPLVELPMYLLLGVVSGVVAGVFSFSANRSKAFFDGSVGPSMIQKGMQALPRWTKPILGGLTCGAVGIFYPQILFFGYETLNTLLANNSLTTAVVLTLLAVKMFTTAIAVGSGLVGGTFAPSLFLGGMVGASFHDVIGNMFMVAQESPFELADVQAYAIVGAAGVLSALFKAPLTASLLLFELTRDYEVLLPALASAGVGSVTGDLVEKALFEVSSSSELSEKDFSNDESVLLLGDDLLEEQRFEEEA